MKALKLVVHGNADTLSNLVNLVMKNPGLSIREFKFDDPEPDRNHSEIRNLSTKSDTTRAKWSDHPEIVLAMRNGKMAIDCEASARKMGFSLDQLKNQYWQLGTPQHAVKMAHARQKPAAKK